MNLLERRRAMMVQGGGVSPAVKRGTLTLDSTMASIDVQHNIGSNNYILLLRHINPTLGDAKNHGAILIGKQITEDYNFYGASGIKLYTYVMESRSGPTFYGGGMTQAPTDVYDGFTNLSSICGKRLNGYNYAIGDYEWVAINLDATADVEGETALLSDTYSFAINDNLGTTDKVGIVMEKVATYGSQNVVVNVGMGNFFASITNTSTGLSEGFESRNGTSYSQLSDSNRCGITTNSITIQTRANTYVYKAGNYIYKVYKI